MRHERALAERLVLVQPKSYRLVALKHGEITKVDTQDFDLALKYPWYLHTQGYAHDGNRHYLHRLILERMAGHPLTRQDVTDHDNHDKLDNRRHNLKLATTSLNGANMKVPSHNTSGYKGVRWSKLMGGCWQANIKYQQKQIFIGHYRDKEDAAYGYDQFAVALFGDFAYTNVL
jgi:hypothetical protein